MVIIFLFSTIAIAHDNGTHGAQTSLLSTSFSVFCFECLVVMQGVWIGKQFVEFALHLWTFIAKLLGDDFSDFLEKNEIVIEMLTVLFIQQGALWVLFLYLCRREDNEIHVLGKSSEEGSSAGSGSEESSENYSDDPSEVIFSDESSESEAADDGSLIIRHREHGEPTMDKTSCTSCVTKCVIDNSSHSEYENHDFSRFTRRKKSWRSECCCTNAKKKNEKNCRDCVHGSGFGAYS